MGDTLPLTAVIPAYRRPDMVERAVRSVLRQSRPPAEIIVVDDASGDETGARAAALGARVITHEHNRGEGGARNTGVEASSHAWVALLDCDDEWLPGHLETLWPPRDGHVLVGTAVLVTGDAERPRACWGWTGPRPRVLGSPAEVAIPQNKFHPSAVLARRDALIAAGGFSDLLRAADLDMWLRLLEHGSALVIPVATALYHRHPDQVSGEVLPMLEAQTRVLSTYAGRSWCTGAVRRRQAGVEAWDTFRTALSDGAARAPAALELGRRLIHPQSTAGLARLLGRRVMNRRLASRYAADGSPSLAVLPGADLGGAGPHAVDLRGRSWPAALLHLLRRPTGQARARGRLARALVRAIGIDPV
jgi:hypothetical protein